MNNQGCATGAGDATFGKRGWRADWERLPAAGSCVCAALKVVVWEGAGGGSGTSSGQDALPTDFGESNEQEQTSVMKSKAARTRKVAMPNTKWHGSGAEGRSGAASEANSAKMRLT